MSFCRSSKKITIYRDVKKEENDVKKNDEKMMLRKFLTKSKMGTIVGDVKGLAAPPPTYNIPHLVEKIKGFPLKAKSLQNTATYQKLWGGVPSTPRPLVPRWGYEFACTSEG